MTTKFKLREKHHFLKIALLFVIIKGPGYSNSGPQIRRLKAYTLRHRDKKQILAISKYANPHVVTYCNKK